MPSGDISTTTFEDFGNGIDLRLGPVSRAANKFQELSNYVITPGRKLTRRPPMRNVTGQLDASTQFCRFINGKVVTVAPAGATVTHTISGLTVETVYFDMPEKALADWRLIDLAIFNEQLVALIAHRYDSNAAAWRISLHVWDDKRPTYVTDPACPTSWGPSLPLHAFGEGKLGAYVNYEPKLAISSDRLFVSRPDGNVAFSGEGSPRIWNTRTPDEILTDGNWWYFITTNAAGDQSVTLPVPYYDLKIDQRYAAYVLEYCGADGRWVQLREQTLMSAYEDYTIAPVTNRWSALGPAETQITYRLPGDGKVVRFRALAKAPVIVQTGLYVTPAARIVGGILTHEGNGSMVGSYDILPPSPSTDYLVNVVVPGAPIPVPTFIQGGSGAMPLNGQERYWSRTIASIVTPGSTTPRIGGVGIVDMRAFGGPEYALNAPPGYPDMTGLSIGDVVVVNGVDAFQVAANPHPHTYGLGVTALGPVVTPFWDGGHMVLYPWADRVYVPGVLYQLTGTVTVTVGGTRVTGAGTLFTTELEVGRQVEINGERRTVRFIGGDTSFEVDAPFTVAYGPGVGLRDPRYRYAYEIGDAGNEWYAEREAEATFSIAGNNDAGYLGTAMYDSTGELPLSIAAFQNRLLVQFPSGIQAWGVGPNAVSDMRLLSLDGQSAGKNTAPQPALIDGMTALPTVNGVRLFNPDGNNKDYISFIGVGDMLHGMVLPDLTRAIWWPQMRTYLTCATSAATDLTFYALTSHRDTKVLGWQTWAFRGITRVDSMFIAGDDLVIQSGRNLHRVASQDAVSADDNDGADPFESRARWTYCTMGRPEKNKRVVRCEVIQEGSCAVSIYMNPYRPDEKVLGPATVRGTTMGRQRVPMAVMGPGLGLEVSSRDRNGHELMSIAFDHLLLNR